MKRIFFAAVVFGVAISSGLTSCKHDSGLNGQEGKNRKGATAVEGEAVVLSIGEAELIEVITTRSIILPNGFSRLKSLAAGMSGFQV